MTLVLQTSARLLALLSLLQQRREWSGPQLADRLEVGSRTIRRDVEKLRELGYPIEAAPGIAGGYRLAAGAQMPPLLLDDGEAIAVAVGLRSAASGSISGIEEYSVRALAKLEQILPDRLRDRVRALGDATSIFRVDGPQISADQLASIAGACRDGVSLRFSYTSKAGEVSSRLVEPAAVVHTGWRWYLVAFDLDRDDWRTFRLDRIADRPHAGGRVRRREVPGGDPAAFVRRSIRGSDADVVRGRVRLRAPAAVVSARVPARSATVEADGDESCVVTTTGRWSREFLVWMATMDVEITVLEPLELLQEADRIARRLAAAASGDPPRAVAAGRAP
jgi:predicted DNA-binding transcriptional regulator YafY